MSERPFRPEILARWRLALAIACTIVALTIALLAHERGAVTALVVAVLTASWIGGVHAGLFVATSESSTRLKTEIAGRKRQEAALGTSEARNAAIVDSANIERQRAERRLRRAIKARYAAVLAERARVAREMHDGLLQDAMGIALHLRAILPEVRASSEVAANALLPLIDLAEQTTEQARRAIMGMRPDTADGDIVGAIERAVRRAAARKPLVLSVAVTGRARPIRPHIQDAVVRIVQEAALNVTRHAAARSVQLRVSFRPRRLRVALVDDGRGFELPGNLPSPTRHFGLIGMRERADEVRGSLDIRSAPGTGTTVMLQVPYRN